MGLLFCSNSLPELDLTLVHCISLENYQLYLDFPVLWIREFGINIQLFLFFISPVCVFLLILFRCFFISRFFIVFVSGCLLCSCLSLFILLSIVKYFYIGALYSLAIECISLFLIRILAPVQDINRKMEREEIVKFGKKLDCSIIKILFLSILFCILKFYRLLQVVSVTAAFMVGILVIGKISYKKAVSNNQQCI